MQYHGNKTLNQRVFKGIECNTWKQDFKSKSF